MQGTRVLIIEDDAGLSKMLCRGLSEERYQVSAVRDGKTGLAQLCNEKFALCILDVLLPGLDGFELLRRAKQQGVRTPILMLTARDAIADRVHGLQLGADDYLVKPFAFAELSARLQVLLRRGVAPQEKLQVGDIIVDQAAHRVLKSGQEVHLSVRQFEILELLVRHSGNVVSRAMLLRQLWGYDFDPGTNLVDVHITHLRQKLDVPGQPSLIQSVRGVGYRFRKDLNA